MNGTGANDLFNGYREAMDKVQDADEAIRKIEFSARDYYVQGDTAWEQARDEMTERRAALDKIKSEFLQICEHIMDSPRFKS